MKHYFKKYRPLLVAFLFLFLTGCGGDDPNPTPDNSTRYALQKISGDNQTGFSGIALTDPLKVKLLDQDGMPAVNKSVNFAVATGNGTISASTALTDQNGVAQITWTLGPTAPKQTVNAQLVDANNQTILSGQVGFTADLNFTIVGGNGYGNAMNQLASPTGVFVDGSGNIFVADGSNDRIQKFAPGATVGVTVAGGNGRGPAANQFDKPTDVFVDAAGNIFVADGSNDRIQKWVPGATSGITVAGGIGPGNGSSHLYSPKSVFVDTNGNIFVADGFNHRIMKWAPGASFGQRVAGAGGINTAGSGPDRLNAPSGVFVDAAGNIFVADGLNHRVQKFAPGTTIGVTVAGGNGSGPAANQLNGPSDVFVDMNGNIFVSEENNHRIQKFALGTTTGVTVAGGNGKGTAANQLDNPYDIFVAPSGNIFVADFVNNRIQKWEQ